MLFRFCLYGFLKNQQYYDPFLILAFRQKGLSFAAIGVLIGFRAVAVNLLEIPTGAIADVVGRRRSMIASMLAYIGSFLVFGLCQPVGMLFLAMFLFSIGEAFRTGTHKAMIFQWLEHEGRSAEKTAVYGRTRSWSKLGSAVSVVIATALVFCTEQYSSVFLLCIVPYLLNVVNFLGYPAYLDAGLAEGRKAVGVIRTLVTSVGESFRRRPLRWLLIESMGYEGIFQLSKDYLQPVIRAACVSLPWIVALGGHYSLGQRQQVAVGIGLVYFTLHLLSSLASRHARGFARVFGGERRSGRLLWLLDLIVFALMAAAICGQAMPGAVAAFVLLAVLQNFWRPILVSRVASLADPARTATVLSIESQAKSLFVAVSAPLLGWSVDGIALVDPQLQFLPVAIAGGVVSAVMFLAGGLGQGRADRADVREAAGSSARW